MINKVKAMMMVKKKTVTKKDLDSLKEFLVMCSEAYYNTDTKVIDDTDYDYIYNRYIELGGEEIVGAEPTEGKATIDSDHKYKTLVGTLDKCQTMDDLKEWIIKNFPNPNQEVHLYVTLKFDGNSISIEYDQNGNVLKALTRGKDGKGVDLTRVFKDRKVVNKFNEPMGIKYEVLITYSDLEKLNEEFKTEYKNPRSAVSGMLGSNDAYKFKDYFTLEPLWVKPMNINITRTAELIYIQEQFPNSANAEYIYEVIGNREEVFGTLEAIYDEIIGERQDLDFMIDGLVIDIADNTLREKLGFIEGGKTLKPRWATALKFPYMEKESVITGFDFTLGDSGKISPRAWFEPVTFNGATFVKQYLQGYGRFMELGLSIGSKVLVQYRNDCLTYLEPMEGSRLEGVDPFPFASECPVCGGPVVITDTGAFAYCGNPLCEGKVVGRINNFFTKMDIKGIKENTIQKLYDAGIWTKIEDVFSFNVNRAMHLEGMGESSVNKIVKAIAKKKYYDYEILGSLGIPSFSLATAKDLMKIISLEELMNFLTYDESLRQNAFEGVVMHCEGIGEILAENIYEGVVKNKELIKFLMNRGYMCIADELKYDDVRYTFVITGDLEHFKDRGDLKLLLERRGHKVVGSVSGKTDYLITNDPNSGTVKNRKAQELGKPIITEEQLIEMLKIEL